MCVHSIVLLSFGAALLDESSKSHPNKAGKLKIQCIILCWIAFIYCNGTAGEHPCSDSEPASLRNKEVGEAKKYLFARFCSATAIVIAAVCAFPHTLSGTQNRATLLLLLWAWYTSRLSTNLLPLSSNNQSQSWIYFSTIEERERHLTWSEGFPPNRISVSHQIRNWDNFGRNFSSYENRSP